jgi:general secretion pathway protein I
MRRHSCGFTLLEVLVALAIVAVALTGGMRAVGGALRSGELLHERTLANWVAANRLARLRAEGAFPALGDDQGETEQAGRRFVWRQRVQATPNALFRRVDVSVFTAEAGLPLASLSGFVVRPLQ